MAHVLEQFAKDVQQLIADAAAGAFGVYNTEPPRGGDETLAVEPPFVVYTCTLQGEADESGEVTADLMLDAWALGNWAACYRIMCPLDDAFDGATYAIPSGFVTVHRNGSVFAKGAPDESDVRVKRMSGQYLMQFSPFAAGN